MSTTRSAFLIVAALGIATHFTACGRIGFKPDEVEPAAKQSAAPAPTMAEAIPTIDVAGFYGHQFAKRLVPAALKAPATASFPFETVTAREIEPHADGHGDTARRWLVRGSVDAQNSFGAKIRAEWEITVLYAYKTFVPAKAVLEGKAVYVADGYAETSQPPSRAKDPAGRSERTDPVTPPDPAAVLAGLKVKAADLDRRIVEREATYKRRTEAGGIDGVTKAEIVKLKQERAEVGAKIAGLESPE